MTETVKHTPGPWEVHGEVIMADPRRHLPDTMLGIATIQDHSGDRPASVIDANAHLIAAAPDMLEALIMALPYVETAEFDEGYKPGVVAKVAKAMRAAIDSAEGRS